MRFIDTEGVAPQITHIYSPVKNIRVRLSPDRVCSEPNLGKQKALLNWFAVKSVFNQLQPRFSSIVLALIFFMIHQCKQRMRSFRWRTVVPISARSGARTN